MEATRANNGIVRIAYSLRLPATAHAERYAKEQMSEIIEAIGKVIEGGLGFRYLFSRTYRKKTQQRWKNQSRMSIAFEVLETAIGVAVVIIILFALLGIIR
jgi:hypothetical protein